MLKLENAPILISLIVGLTLACSLSYDYGYFLISGLSFLGALSAQDHISMGIIYIPIVLFFILLTFVTGVFQLEFRELNPTTDKNILPFKISRIWKWVIVLVTPHIAFVAGDNYNVLFYTVPAAFAIILTFQALEKLTKISPRLSSNIVFSSCALLLFFSIGSTNARNDMGAQGGNFELVVEENGQVHKIEVAAIQIYQDNVIYFFDGQPTLLSKSRLISVRDLQIKKYRAGRGFCESLRSTTCLPSIKEILTD